MRTLEQIQRDIARTQKEKDLVDIRLKRYKDELQSALAMVSKAA